MCMNMFGFIILLFVCGTASKCNETPIFILLSRIAAFLSPHSLTDNAYTQQYQQCSAIIFYMQTNTNTYAHFYISLPLPNLLLFAIAIFFFSAMCTIERAQKK